MQIAKNFQLEQKFIVDTTVKKYQNEKCKNKYMT